MNHRNSYVSLGPPVFLEYEEFLSHVKTETVLQMLLLRAPFLQVCTDKRFFYVKQVIE